MLLLPGFTISVEEHLFKVKILKCVASTLPEFQFCMTEMKLNQCTLCMVIAYRWWTYIHCTHYSVTLIRYFITEVIHQDVHVHGTCSVWGLIRKSSMTPCHKTNGYRWWQGEFSPHTTDHTTRSDPPLLLGCIAYMLGGGMTHHVVELSKHIGRCCRRVEHVVGKKWNALTFVLSNWVKKETSEAEARWAHSVMVAVIDDTVQ